MPKFGITFVNYSGSGIDYEVVEAAYYQRADGWTTFKNDGGKFVCDIPSNEIRMIKRIDEKAGPDGEAD